MSRDLKLVVLDSAKELGFKVNDHLKELRKNNAGYLCKIENPRFSNGEGKVKILDSVRDVDLYILADVGNYDVLTNVRGRQHYLGPDEHYQDIKRVILADSGHADKISVIMPLLYEGRQHRRKGRESLDCALALQELQSLGVKNIVTFDAHEPDLSNAVPTLPFENFYPTNKILETIFQIESNDMDNLMVVSPDEGAINRAMHYAEMLGCEIGSFYKLRDYDHVEKGKNPVKKHFFLGGDVTDKTILVVDDMISSGDSVIDTAKKLKERGAAKVYICVTFALFTEGIERMNEAYQNGYFDHVYATNVSYVAPEIKECAWYTEVDCSRVIAEIINHLNNGTSLEPLHNYGKETYRRLRLLRQSEKNH